MMHETNMANEMIRSGSLEKGSVTSRFIFLFPDFHYE